MKPILKLLLSGILLVAAMAAGPASASTIFVNYTGVVTEVNNTNAVSGYSVGQSITGKMILSLPDTPQRSYLSGVPFFDAYNGSGSSAINGSTISGFGSIDNRSLSGFASLSFGVSETIGSVQYAESIYFEGHGAIPLLGSLQALPTDLASIKIYLQNSPYSLIGQIFANAPGMHVFDVHWDVTSVDVAGAPIPASLPLFVAALAMLAFIGRRRLRREGVPRLFRPDRPIAPRSL